MAKHPKAQFSSSRTDSWRNAMTGLGTSRDKRTLGTYQRGTLLDRELLRGLYDDNDLASRVVDLIPAEALRQGMEIKLGGDEEREAEISGRVDELQLESKLEEAAAWGRLYGGGGLLLGVDDGQAMDKPLRPDYAGVRTIKYATVLDRWDVTIERRYANPLAPQYGEAEIYRVIPQFGPMGFSSRSGGTLVHESRMIWFGGARTPRRSKIENKGWSLSILQRMWDVMRDFGMGWDGVSLLLQEASQSVYGVKGLMEILAGEGGEELMRTRFRTIEESRSVARAMIIDTEESWERKPTSFTGVADILDRFTKRLAAAARVPVTVLMGEAPAGLNATGSSDLQIFYDSIRAWQKHELRPRAEKLVRLLLAENSAAEPESWDVCFPPLEQPSQVETADVRLKTAQADKIYFDMGALTPEEIALNRFGAEGYSTETTINLELRRELEDVHEETAVDEAKASAERAINPPAPVVAPGAVPGKDPKAPPAEDKSNAPPAKPES